MEELKKKIEKIMKSQKGVFIYILIGVLVTHFLVPSNHMFWYTLSILAAPFLYMIKRQDWTSYIYGGMVFAALTYFLIGVALASKLPIVVVSSGSMDHGINSYGYPCRRIIQNYTEDFENWWKLCGDTYEKFNITEEKFKSFPFKDGLKVGDILLVGGGKYKVGDVIIYDIGQKTPIIHRIVKINPDGTYQTKGDHNLGQNIYEFSVHKEQIIGKAIAILVPRLGYLRIIVSWLGI